MTPIILLCTCLPLWALALLLFAQRFPKNTKQWFSWASVLFLLIPVLFFPLSAYADKREAMRMGNYTLEARQEFRLRLWICACSYMAELIIGFLLKYIGVELYGELAVSCGNIFLFLLILTCWDLFRPLRY
ncbi:hypothetical protein EV202_12010 [Bacteroides heparinolyticus]|uniref:Transmembrane protein n=1 Tax=Prevotella heparinolytica TaxID=28113 RepID=A0A4R2LPG1_9BACE|nr:hypothetical protein [Bacteroides heparinolyticus]TCO89475.1 hypothetical protein EV202_12010 [Bacteroides heparinolyticus]